MTTETKSRKKVWIDAEGREIPAAYVPKLDKQKDRTARLLLRRAEQLEAQLRMFKEETFERCDAIWQEMLDQHDVRTGEKSYTIHSFDRTIKIEVAQAERISFDDNITIAKAKLFEWLDEKLGEDDTDLRAVVHHAFETRKGQLDTHRILGLFGLKIRAKKWIEAMELIKKSIRRDLSRRYARIYVKNEATGQWRQINLNFSSIEL